LTECDRLRRAGKGAEINDAKITLAMPSPTLAHGSGGYANGRSQRSREMFEQAGRASDFFFFFFLGPRTLVLEQGEVGDGISMAAT